MIIPINFVSAVMVTDRDQRVTKTDHCLAAAWKSEDAITPFYCKNPFSEAGIRFQLNKPPYFAEKIPD